jgi:ferric enterobactin receptor
VARLTWSNFIAVLIFLIPGLRSLGQTEATISADFSRTGTYTMLKMLSSEFDVKLAYDSRPFKRLKSGPFEFRDVPVGEVLDQILGPHGYGAEPVADVWVIVPKQDSDRDLPVNEVRTNVEFRGRVVDAYSGEGLPGASVAVRGTNQRIWAGTEGFFYVPSLSSDTAALIVSYIGYSTRVIKLTSGGKDRVREIRLSRTLAALPPAVVESGSGPMMAAGRGPGALLISGELPGQMANAGEADILWAAQIAPGVSAASESGSGLEIRGTGESLSMTTMDGFNVYHTDHLLGSISAVNPDFVRDVRIHRGALPADKGGSAGGLVEITGRNGNQNTEEIIASVSGLTTGLVLSLPLKEQNGSYLIACRMSHVGLLPTPVYKSVFGSIYNRGIPNLGEEDVDVFSGDNAPTLCFWDIALRANFNPTERKSVVFSALASSDDLVFGYEEPIEFPGTKWTYRDEATWGNVGLSLKMSDSWSNGIISELLVSAARFGSRALATDIREDLWFGLRDTLFSNLTNDISDLGLRWNVRISEADRTWNLGAEARQYWVKYRSFRPDNLTDEAFDQSALIGAVCGETSLKSERQRQWVFGLRLETLDGKYFYPAPKIFTSKTLGEKWIWSIEAGRQYMQVQRLTRQDIGFNDPVLWRIADHERMFPTRLDHFGTGFQRVADKWTMTFEGYYRLLRNVNLHRSLFPVAALPEGLPEVLSGRGSVLGADIAATFVSGSHRAVLSASGGYSLIEPESPDPTVIFSPAHRLMELKGLYTLRHRGWMASAVTVYAFGRPFTPLIGRYYFPLPNGSQREIPVFGKPNSGRLPDYHRFDLMAGREFETKKLKFEVGLNVFNVLNRRNIRDIRYFAVATTNQPGSFTTVTNEPGMLGRMPGLFFRMIL